MGTMGVSNREVGGRLELGSRLRELRQESGLSRREVCRRSGLAETTLDYLERGDRTPGVATLRALAQVYGVSPLELVEPLAKPEPFAGWKGHGQVTE